MPSGGWSKKLDVLIEANVPAVAHALADGYDESGLGKKSGALRAAVANIANYFVQLGKDGIWKRIKLTIPLAYARIQDIGGDIPERFARNARAMHFFAYGKEWFLKSVKGFKLKGSGYLSVHGRDQVAQQTGKIIKVGWK